MVRYLVNVSYDGLNFVGFARQPGHRTVQGVLEAKISEFLNGEKIEIFATGRTDRWVHAKKQFFHFDSKYPIDINGFTRFIDQIPDLRIGEVKIVSDKFHARFNAHSKTYLYKINIGSFNVFERNYVMQLCKPINLQMLDTLFSKMIGVHDFASFSAREQYGSSEREVYSIKVDVVGDIIEIRVSGNGFLRYMVRNIIGASLAVILGQEKEDYIDYLLKEPKRGLCHYKAPALGLYLEDVVYGEHNWEHDGKLMATLGDEDYVIVAKDKVVAPSLKAVKKTISK